jgi:hypothetical protein
LTLVAGGTGALLLDLKLRAKPVQVSYTQQVTRSDTGSIADYGKRAFPSDLPWCGVEDAKAVLDAAIAQRSEALPIVTVKFVVGFNLDRAAEVLTLDLSDRVTIEEPETGLSDDFYIESIRHELTGEHDHTVTFGLELCPTDAPDPDNILILDSNVAGHRLNSGYLAN